MRRFPQTPTLLLSLCACANPNPEDRARIDQNIGRLETTNFALTAKDGSLHVLNAQENQLNLRATHGSWEFDLENRSASALQKQLIIDNISEDSSLQCSPFPVFSDNGEDASSVSMGAREDGYPLRKVFSLTLPETSTITCQCSSSSAEPVPFSFLATGDIQDGIGDFDEVVSVANQQKDVDFFLFLGDVTMRNTFGEFVDVETAFQKFLIPVYVTPGNHDVSVSHMNYQKFFGRGSYSFVHKGAQFTSLDTAGWTLSKTVWQWYRSWLKEGKQRLHVVYGHIAPTESLGIRGGHWRSRREAAAFQALAARGKVDALIFGHLHTLDVFRLAGIPTFISGGGGAFEEEDDGIARHLLRFDVNPETQSLKYQVIRVDP